MKSGLAVIEGGQGAQEALFDYQALDAEARVVVQQKTEEIRDLVRATAENVVKIGGKLAEVQQRLNGRFGAWLAVEFSEWSERTVYNFIAVWQKFGSHKSLANFATSALYLLAAPSTPPAALKAAEDIAKSGEQVTHKLAKTLVAVAKDAEPKTQEMFTGSEPEEIQENSDTETETEDSNPEPQGKTDHESAKPELAKMPAKKPEPAKPATGSAALKFIAESQFQINVRLMPADDDPRGRQAIVAISANDGPPVISSRRLPGTGDLWPGPVGEALRAFIETESQKAALKPAAKTKKTAAKTAKKRK